MRVLLALCALLLAPTAAQAEWLEASSAHFVVYADDSERNIRRFSDQLERYHEAMEVVTGLELEDPSPSNRVTVYVVKSMREVQRLFGVGGRSIGGFYLPRAGASVAVVPQVEVSSTQLDTGMTILLHEYAHHFLISNSTHPMPRWLSEGGAEFFAAARFPSDGGLAIGLPAAGRYMELAYADQVKVEELLDPDVYEKRRSAGFDSFYGKSWALYHYLTFDPERRGQLRSYMAGMAAGQTSREAALAAFGSLADLDRDVLRYLRKPQVLSMTFQPGQLEAGAIAVRQLGGAEAAIMPVRIRSRRGVTREQAIELLGDAREIAARHPDDPAVQAALAEAEYDAGNDAEAIAAADRALASDSARVDAYVQKGFALFRRAAEADDREAAYRAAVAPFVALNQLENDHPLPLIYYFRSFAESGRRPPDTAVQGLERAAELAPFDLGLRMSVATHQISEGRLEDARFNLVPIAYSPHPNPMSAGARTVIERIDAGEASEPTELLQLLSGPPAENAVVGP